jgi:hypothetical protein
MTEDAAQAEETRQQMLPVEGVAEVNIVDLPGWVALSTAADPPMVTKGANPAVASPGAVMPVHG